MKKWTSSSFAARKKYRFAKISFSFAVALNRHLDLNHKTFEKADINILFI